MDRLVNTDYADERFERMGVEQQMDANSWASAKQAYENACMLCCTRGCGAVQCAHCKIREAMLVNGEQIFWKRLSEQEKDWIRKEKELR